MPITQNKVMLEKYQNALDAATQYGCFWNSRKKHWISQEGLNDQKDRLTLKALTDGTILRIIPKVGENVSPNAPVLLLQSSELYFDLFVPETQVKKFSVGGSVPVHVISQNKMVSGTVRFINSAPQYTSTRMSRDNGQGDLSTFQVRIDLQGDNGLLPGMTVEVNTDVAD
jgi:HlyD family secretion protein